jgi:hypothetical protein
MNFESHPSRVHIPDITHNLFYFIRFLFFEKERPAQHWFELAIGDRSIV